MKCQRCDREADGLDGWHCQVHWEMICSESWWEMGASRAYQELELIAAMEQEESSHE